MNVTNEVEEPSAKRVKLEDDGQTSQDSQTSLNSQMGLHVTLEEVEKLREFQVLDEVNEDEDSNNEGSNKDESSDELPEEEIERMLEEDLPEDFKGIPKPMEKKYVKRQKIILEEKGINYFEVLPLDWMMVRHSSGMPVYMHRNTRVCTLSKPYFLGKGNTRRHDIPISAIPCLAYRIALKEEKKQIEIDKNIAEQIKNGTWADPYQIKDDPKIQNQCNDSQNTETNADTQNQDTELSLNSDIKIPPVNGIVKPKCPFSNKFTNYVDMDVGFGDDDRDSKVFQCVDKPQITGNDKSNTLIHQNSVPTDENNGNPDKEHEKKYLTINGYHHSPNTSEENSQNPVPEKNIKNAIIQDLKPALDELEKNLKQNDLELGDEKKFALEVSLGPSYEASLDSPTTGSNTETQSSFTLDNPSTGASNTAQSFYSLDGFSQALNNEAHSSCSYALDNPSTEASNEAASCSLDGRSVLSAAQSTLSLDEPSPVNLDTLAARPVVLPGGLVMPPPRVETVSSSWKCQQLSAGEVNDYCKRLFKFKEVHIMHFRRWADRRKYTKARKTMQYPSLPAGTKLITIPAQDATADNGGKSAKRDWVMNMNGCSYLSVFHEYVRRALHKQPLYEFKQLENATAPYQATVYIGGMQYGVGRGSSKRQAKSQAARASIHILIPEMRDELPTSPGDLKLSKDDPDFTFFDYVTIEDPRIQEFCGAAAEPSPHAILRTCLLRNFGAGDRHIQTEMKKLEFQKIELTMKVGKHSATVVCKNKKQAKQLASQAILQQLHPHITSWGSLLRLYGSRSVKTCKEKKLEEQQITLLQDKARHNEPNHAVLEKLRNEMQKLKERDNAVVPIGTLMVSDDLPTHSGSNLNNVDL